MVLLPQEQMLLHVATTADLLYIIRTQCHVDVPDALIQVTEARRAQGIARRPHTPLSTLLSRPPSLLLPAPRCTPPAA